MVTHHTQGWARIFQVPTANPLHTFAPRGTQMLSQPESDIETCSTSWSWVISVHQLMPWLLLLLTHCSQSYTHSRPCHYGHMGPPPHALTLGAAHRYPCTQRRGTSYLGKSWEKIFYKGDRQVISCRARPDKSTDYLHEVISSNPLIPLFSHSCSSQKSPEHPPFPTIDFCPKHPVNSVWCQTAFPLHPTVCHPHRAATPLSMKDVFKNCSPWHPVVVFMPDVSAETALLGVWTSWFFLGVVGLCTQLSLWFQTDPDGLVIPVMAWE